VDTEGTARTVHRMHATAVTLRSRLDASINWVGDTDDGGKVEARYVRRDHRPNGYFIAYVSSHTGCAKGCRFCHLTQTAQTQMTAVDIDGIVAQAEQVLAHHDQHGSAAAVVHYNFMARGEALANPHILAGGDELYRRLAERAVARDLQPAVKISTIWPTELDGRRLSDTFAEHQPDIYYSIYSTNPDFRRRWLPRALPHTEALAALADWQHVTRKIPVLHWAFIAGENDSDADIDGITAAVTDAGLRVDVNIVRYNPYSTRQGTEPPEARIHDLAERLRRNLAGARVQVVSRVGPDIGASCGMFVGGRNPVITATR
jgi:adenine C2-methylase RlmN of 23S rRNA A2503 and tRNA A37